MIYITCALSEFVLHGSKSNNCNNDNICQCYHAPNPNIPEHEKQPGANFITVRTIPKTGLHNKQFLSPGLHRFQTFKEKLQKQNGDVTLFCNSEYVAHCIGQNVTLHTAIPNTQQVGVQYTLTIIK